MGHVLAVSIRGQGTMLPASGLWQSHKDRQGSADEWCGKSLPTKTKNQAREEARGSLGGLQVAFGLRPGESDEVR